MTQQDTLYYDGTCGLCQGAVRALRRLDWLQRLRYADMSAVPPEDLPVRADEAQLGLPMRTREGDVLIGYPAMRRALRQTPLGLVPALLMHLPVVSWLGRVCYAWIARRRHALSCALPTRR